MAQHVFSYWADTEEGNKPKVLLIHRNILISSPVSNLTFNTQRWEQSYTVLLLSLHLKSFFFPAAVTSNIPPGHQCTYQAYLWSTQTDTLIKCTRTWDVWNMKAMGHLGIQSHHHTPFYDDQSFNLKVTFRTLFIIPSLCMYLLLNSKGELKDF